MCEHYPDGATPTNPYTYWSSACNEYVTVETVPKLGEPCEDWPPRQAAKIALVQQSCSPG